MDEVKRSTDGRRLYPVGDSLNFEERKALNIDIGSSVFLHSIGTHPKGVAVIRTGVFRCPKKGEWYISGAIPAGYRAPNDLSTMFHIGRLVKVKTTTTIVHEVVNEAGVA